MKLLIFGAMLLLISAASFAQALPGAAGPQPRPGAASDARTPPSSEESEAARKGPSCRRAPSGTCRGCSITCEEGERAVCSDPLYSWNSNKCIRDAACNCRPPRRH
jgi:hypothetical protein